MAATLIKTGTKVAIGVGAIYFTLNQGVWGSGNQGSSALQRIEKTAIPTMNEYMQKVPSATEAKDSFASSWNSGVSKVFGGVASAPDTVAEYTYKAVDEVKKSLK